MNRFTKIASAAAVAAALTVPATGALAATKTENALIGGALGALAGALIGNGDTSAVVGGAAVGALVGVATDKPDRRYVGSRQVRNDYRTSYRAQPAYRGYNQPAYRTNYAPAYRGDYAPAYRSNGYVPTGYRYGY
jgi:hypothetical protein